MSRYLQAIKKRSRHLINRFKNICQGSFCQYNQEAPHPQQMIDLFESEWISCFPPPFDTLKGGIYPLFEDARVAWGIQQLGGVKSKTILELGPLEGGHSYMLQQAGASSVVAIEANPHAYLKCLLVKQMMKLERVEFLFGDFNAYLRAQAPCFDACIASGVLYHMKNPVQLLALIAQKCQALFLWTHYYDANICNQMPLKSKFLKPYSFEVEGFKHTLYPFRYGASRVWSTFIGGPATTSCWLSRQEILDGLRHFGFSDMSIHFEDLNSPHGPCFSLVAKK